MSAAVELARYIGVALYIGVWYFACRAGFKGWWRGLEWVPVAYLGIGLPMIVADVVNPLPAWRAKLPALFAAYLAIPVATITWQLARRLRKNRTNDDRPFA